MSELNASNLRKEHGNEGPDLVGTTELTSPYFMVPPSGTTIERPQNPQKGTLRFNTDIGSLEYFKGDIIGWESINRYSPNLGDQNLTNSARGTGARGLYFCGSTPGDNEINNIEYYTIPTQGNGTDFGDATVAVRQGCALSSATRALHLGGFDGSNRKNDIGYVTVSSTGNAADFGDLSQTCIGHPAGFASATRGINAAGESPGNTNEIEYVTIASTGNAVDFGDLNAAGSTNGVMQSTGASSNGHGGL